MPSRVLLSRHLCVSSRVGEACALEILYPDLAFDSLVKGYHRIGRLDVGNLLDRVQEDLHQVVVIQALGLQEEVRMSGNEVTFHDFGDMLESLYDFGIFVGL